MYLNNAIIEVTRKCNMACCHCLRGNAQNKEISKETLSKFLLNNDIRYISTVTFTGGEPSLNCQAINDFIDICSKHAIEVGNFYIATNGKQVTESFISTCLRLFLFCSENEVSQIEISRSDYHIDQNEEAIKKLKCLRFVSERPYLSYKNLIDEGKAKSLNQLNGIKGQKKKIYPLTIEDNIIDGEIYLNCKGDICSSCDLSYRRQDKNKLGNVYNKSLMEMINSKEVTM